MPFPRLVQVFRLIMKNDINFPCIYCLLREMLNFSLRLIFQFVGINDQSALVKSSVLTYSLALDPF